MKMKKEDFNAGSPYSCWLKEELIGEILAHLYGLKDRGLAKKYNVHVDETNEDAIRDCIMNIRKLDDLPDDLKKVAVDIIKMELDKNFKI